MVHLTFLSLRILPSNPCLLSYLQFWCGAQVGGYTDFEELLNEVREECHAAAEAYLTAQVGVCG